jgi:hypothetical protein
VVGAAVRYKYHVRHCASLLHMRLMSHASQIQTVQTNRLDNRPVPCASIRHRPDWMMTTDSLKGAVCIAENTFHGHYNLRIWGPEKNPHVLLARLVPKRHFRSLRTSCAKHRQSVWWSLLVLQLKIEGHAVVQLVDALRYKSEGRGFDFRWCH